MGTLKEFLETAQREIGTTENPPGSNMVEYATWAGIPGQPWCDAFVSWVANKSGVDVGGVYVYCPFHVDYFKKAGQWVERSQGAQPGDVVFFANRGTASHVGIVESVNGSIITTIEGNTSVSSNDNGGAVMRRTRSTASGGGSFYVLGYGRPSFDEEKKPEEKTEVFDMAECIFYFEDAHEGYPRASRVYWSTNTGFLFLSSTTSVGATNFLKGCGVKVVGTSKKEPYVKHARNLTPDSLKSTYGDLTPHA